MINLAKLREELIRDEGYEKRPYFDHKGFVSFGIGRNLIGNPLTRKEREYGVKVGFYSAAFVQHLYENDINTIIDDLDQNFSWWRSLSPSSQRGIVNMRFQLGDQGFRDFKLSLPLLASGKIKEAGKHLRKSKWWREDTPERAERTIRLIEGSDV